MSAESYRRDVQRASQDIARLQDQKAREARGVSDEMRKAAAATEAAARATSLSTRASKTRDATRHHEAAARQQGKVAGIDQQIARAQGRLSDAQSRLNAAEQQEEKRRQQDFKRQSDELKRQDQAAKRRMADEDRHAREQERRFDAMSNTLRHHDDLHSETFNMIESITKLPEKIVVVFFASSPLDQNPLRLDEEVRAIGETIRKSEHRDAVRLESRWAARPLDILQTVNELKPTVVHFSGHGATSGELVFQDDHGRAKVVAQEAIVQTLAVAGDVRLVFLNACHSRNQAEALVQHVDAAIGMSAPIGDRAARVFAAQFYSAIGFGESVERAFQQAKAALMLEGIPEAATPQLFVRAGVDATAMLLVAP